MPPQQEPQGGNLDQSITTEPPVDNGSGGTLNDKKPIDQDTHETLTSRRDWSSTTIKQITSETTKDSNFGELHYSSKPFRHGSPLASTSRCDTISNSLHLGNVASRLSMGHPALDSRLAPTLAFEGLSGESQKKPILVTQQKQSDDKPKGKSHPKEREGNKTKQSMRGSGQQKMKDSDSSFQNIEQKQNDDGVPHSEQRRTKQHSTLSNEEQKQYDMDDIEQKQKDLDDTEQKQVDLDDTEQKQVDLDDTEQKQVDLDDIEQKQEDLDNIEQKQVDLDDTEQKKVDLDNTEQMQGDLNNIEQKQEDLDDNTGQTQDGIEQQHNQVQNNNGELDSRKRNFAKDDSQTKLKTKSTSTSNQDEFAISCTARSKRLQQERDTSKSITKYFGRQENKVSKEVQQATLSLLRTPRNEVELAELVSKIKESEWLPSPPRQRVPKFEPRCPVQVRVASIQRFINSFEYNHTGTNYFEVRKDLGMKRVCNTAKEIIREALPIKCIEAVFLASYLTAGMHDIVRIPVRFLSTVEGFQFRHIVLAIRVQIGKKLKWGALGLSRKKSLMDKPVKFEKLSDLLLDYKTCYEELGHRLLHIGVGLPLSHNQYSAERIYWRPIMLKLTGMTWPQVTYTVELFTSKVNATADHVYATGKLPEEFVNLLNLPNSEESKNGTETTKKNTSGSRKRIESKPKTLSMESAKNQTSKETQNTEDSSTQNLSELSCINCSNSVSDEEDGLLSPNPLWNSDPSCAIDGGKDVSFLGV